MNEHFVRDQGRPRGAPRRRRHLHGGGPGDDRPGRLAADRLPRLRGRALLRRHLLPARAAPRAAELPPGPGGDLGRLSRPARGAARGLGQDPRVTSQRPARSSPVGRASSTPSILDAGGRGAPRRASTAPTAASAARPSSHRRARSSSCLPAASTEPVARHARQDDARRHLRPARRRLRPLLGRRQLARPALREDALRQRAAGARLPARLAGDGRGALDARLPRDARLGAPRDARPGGRLLLRARRGLGGRGGPLLRLGRGRDARGAERGRHRRRRDRAGPRLLGREPRPATSRAGTSSTCRSAPARQQPAGARRRAHGALRPARQARPPRPRRQAAPAPGTR